MPAITIFDSEQEIPESVKDKATKREDGKFEVDASAFVSKHNEILGEKKTRDQKIRELEGIAEKYKDLDPEKARAALQQIADAENEKLRVQGDWDAREKAINDGWQSKETAWTDEKSGYDKMLDKLVIRNELARVASLPEVQGDFELLADNATVMSRIRRKGEDYEILDESGTVRYGADGKPLRMDAYLKELRQHPKLSRLFDATGASGSGAPANAGGAGGKQPKRSEMSNSERAKYIRENGQDKYFQLPK